MSGCCGWQVRACADEVFYFEKMEVNDFRNDVLLAEACRSDVEHFCKADIGRGVLFLPTTPYRLPASWQCVNSADMASSSSSAAQGAEYRWWIVMSGA